MTSKSVTRHIKQAKDFSSRIVDLFCVIEAGRLTFFKWKASGYLVLWEEFTF